AQSTLIAFTIVQHGYPIIHAQHLINNYEPLYPYFEAASLVILGDSNFAYRLPAALFGISLIPVSYYIGSRLRDRYVGIALAAMMTFSSEFIAWSRQARWYILLVLLMALSMLVIIAWTRTTARRRRLSLFLALLALVVLSAFTSIGLFLLYVPAIMAGALVYYVAVEWTEVRRFFGVPEASEGPVSTARYVPFWIRQLVAILLPVSVVLVALADPGLVGRILTGVLARAVGFTPYPLVWSPNFGLYLVQFYLGVLVLVAIGAIAILWRQRPLELALLAFCGAAFVSVSSLASLTNDIAAGNTSFERHIVPLLFFLFLVAAIALVELVRLLLGWSSRFGFRIPKGRALKPFVFGVFVVLLLVLPGIGVPSGQLVHTGHTYPGSQNVTWIPFSIDPRQPSALLQADQANYELGAEYVIAHRNATDVVAATNPGAPEVYLGTVQYWVRGNANNNTVITVDGQPEFFQTGSVLLANVSRVESMMFNHTGWLISDVPSGKGIAFPGGLNLTLSLLMRNTTFPADGTIVVYQWHQTSPLGILISLSFEKKNLVKFQNDTTHLINWAALNGTTWSNLRPLLLPLEPWLVTHVQPNLRGLATLISVYNQRKDLQTAYPLVNATPPDTSDAALLHWAKEVVDGTRGDPSQPILEPFKAYYDAYG
ncbi:MAG: glycosyltransferase family 39 protein, partial [Thermoplasmata archaeon]|nr:glycosyltransferase family 39 protein [Thermoplasmata archaeon]